jgi:ribosomal protein S17E
MRIFTLHKPRERGMKVAVALVALGSMQVQGILQFRYAGKEIVKMAQAMQHNTRLVLETENEQSKNYINCIESYTGRCLAREPELNEKCIPIP